MNVQLSAPAGVVSSTPRRAANVRNLIVVGSAVLSRSVGTRHWMSPVLLHAAVNESSFWKKLKEGASALSLKDDIRDCRTYEGCDFFASRSVIDSHLLYSDAV